MRNILERLRRLEERIAPPQFRKKILPDFMIEDFEQQGVKFTADYCGIEDWGPHGVPYRGNDGSSTPHPSSVILK